MNFKNNKFRISYIDIVLAVLLIIIIFLIPYLYVINEKTFYYWDYNYYHITTLIKGLELYDIDKFSLDNILNQISIIWHSTYNEYNDYFKLPIVPFVLIFGDSREVFIVSITLLYFLPMVLSISYLSTILIEGDNRNVFWTTCLISILTPVLWLPDLKGFPDSISVALLCIASAIYLKKDLRSYRDMLIIAICLALAVLLRRHFLYDAVTFFVIVLLLNIHKCISFQKSNIDIDFRKFSEVLKNVVFLGVLILFFLSLLGWPFVQRIIDSNTALLYSSWYRSAHENIFYFINSFGLLSVILALSGLLLAAYKNILNLKAISFTLLFLIIIFLLWVSIVKQIGTQYTLHFTPWLILGLVSLLFGCSELTKGHKKSICMALFFVFMAGNFIFSLLGSNNSEIRHTETNRINNLVFSEKIAPVRRSDYNEITRLINYLREKAKPSDMIYVASSSDVLNDDIIKQTNMRMQNINYPTSLRNFWERDGHNLNVPYIPFADKIHPYPLELLNKSKFVILAVPLQYHLRLEEQDILKLVYDIFTKKWDFSKDFVKTGEEFDLENNTKIYIYKRIRETSLPNLIKTLNRMEKYVETRPGGQYLWLDINNKVTNIDIEEHGGVYNIKDLTLGKYDKRIELMSIDKIKGELTLSGEIKFMSRDCGHIVLNLAYVNDDGLSSGKVNSIAIKPTQNNFSLHYIAAYPKRFIITMTNDSNKCIFNISKLALVNN